MKALKIIILFFVVSIKCFSQEAPVKKLLPRLSVRAAVTIPKVVSSQAFAASFSGIFDANISVNLRLFSNFTFGAGYDGTLFVNQLYFRQQGQNTRLQIHDGFLRLGYDYLATEKRFWTFSLCSGVSYNLYTGVSANSGYTGVPASPALTARNDSLNARPRSFFAPFLRPEIAINFLVEENFAFGIHVAYNYCLYTYDPRYCAFDVYSFPINQPGQLKINDVYLRNRANMGWISFGFGFYYGFKKKKR